MNRSLLLFLFLITLPLAILAQDGTLDPSFGGGAGFITNSNSGSFNSVAVQTDGKIVALGVNQSNFFLVMRFNTNGSVDTTFGGTGTGGVIIPLSAANFVTIQSDGKILIAGETTAGNAAVIRYNSNGSLDTNFGEGGTATSSAGNFITVAQQADGTIIAGGVSSTVRGGLLVQFNNDGTINKVFDPVPTQGGGAFYSIINIAIQADEKIVCLIPNLLNSGAINLVRYNTNGTIDNSFGEEGIATGPLEASANGLCIQADGKLLASSKDSTQSFFQVARFNTDGSLDTNYNFPLGYNTTVLCSSDAREVSLTMQADGKAVLCSYDPTDTFFQLARYNTNGTLDTSFGNNGIVTAPVTNGTGFITSALQSNGYLVVAGGNTTNGFIARYLSSPALVTTTVNSPRSSNPISVNTPTQFSGQAQDPSLVFLFIDGVLQPQGTHTDPNNWSITETVTIIGTHTAQAVSLYQNGDLDIASDPITFTAGPQAPSSFTGTITKNEFLNKTECVLQATFTPSINPATTQYIVAQNGIVLATIPATAPLQFVYCASCKGNAFNGITVSAATASGIVGAPQPLVVTTIA